jgi:hypothetical protein
MSARPVAVFITGWLESLSKLRVVLAEDDVLLREGLASLLDRAVVTFLEAR